METYPHYLIVVKDFALPTIFNGIDTGEAGSGIKSVLDMSGGNKLKTPMCALNTGKIQRQTEDAAKCSRGKQNRMQGSEQICRYTEHPSSDNRFEQQPNSECVQKADILKYRRVAAVGIDC